jgi:uncharacterized protein (DUF4415 family)
MSHESSRPAGRAEKRGKPTSEHTRRKNEKSAAKNRKSGVARGATKSTSRRKTDWDRVRSMSEAEIESNARADRDNPLWTDDMLARAVKRPARTRVAISIRVDPEVLEAFQSAGPGYQSRMNDVLRTYVEAQRQQSR